MKWIIAALVLANLALLMWGVWYHEPLVALQAARPPVEVAPDKIKLLAEPGARLVVRGSEAKQARSGEGNSAGTRCHQLGPFPTLEKARTAGARLGTWGLTYERIAEFETLGPAYRVVVPPLPSKEAAERRRREIAALGFTDNAPIQGEAGMENAISFGIFSVEQNARARAQQLARKGIQTVIQPIPNVLPIYWLAIAGVSSEGELAGVPLDRFASEDWGAPDVALRPTPCHTEAAGR
jgi:hypothetical protein